MKPDERTVTTGKGESKKEIKYMLDFPTTIDECIQVAGDENGVVALFNKAYAVQQDGEARMRLCPRSSLLNVPETIEGARAKFGAILANHGEEAAKEYLEAAMEQHPTIAEGISPRMLALVGL